MPTFLPFSFIAYRWCLSCSGCDSLRHGAVGVLHHSGKVKSDLAVPQHPAIRESHRCSAIGGGRFYDLNDHKSPVIAFAPERDFDVQIFECEDSLEMLTQLIPTTKVARLSISTEAADEQRIGSVLIEDPFDVLVQDERNMLFV